MMKSYASPTQAIKAKLSLVDIARRYVELKRAGNRWVAPCPFHQETKPSFSINEDEGLFYCFGCQASGDLFDFYGRINGLDFRESLEQLAEEAGVSLAPVNAQHTQAAHNAQSQRREILRMYDVASLHFIRTLAGEEGEECRAYITQRGLSDAIVEGFGLGWSSRSWQGLEGVLRRSGFSMELAAQAGLLGKSEHGRMYDRFRGRFMFPIRSLSNQVIAFGGRIIGDEDEAKYINSSDSPVYRKGDHLYGLLQARRGIAAAKSALLTEGYMDVLTLHQFGYANAVGVLGTALTPEQIKRLSGFTSHIELLFDGDNAGRKATLRACELFLVRGLQCSVIVLPQGEDIDSLLRSQGTDAFDELRRTALDGMQFCIREMRQRSPKESVEWVRAFLANVEMPELLGRYSSLLAKGLDLEETELREKIAARSNTEAEYIPDVPRTGIMCDREILTFAVRYPHALVRLADLGAQDILDAAWAKRLWDKVARLTGDELFHSLEEPEKLFWVRCRTGDAPPLDREEQEFLALKRHIETLQHKNNNACLTAALRQMAGNGDFATDMEYLRAMNALLEKSNGES